VTPFTARTTCRLCAGPDLVGVLDLGAHALCGQFPLPDEPDPPRVPVEVVRCGTCGLVQSRCDVRPELQFTSYFYRSSVSRTMRDHLAGLASEAGRMLDGRQGPVCTAPRVLDVGGNNGLLLHSLPYEVCRRVLVDPSDVPVEYPDIRHVRGFFPGDVVLTAEYDLIFTVACLYDAVDPLSWARAAKRLLAPDGLWVVEVADLKAVLDQVAFDFFVQEHTLLLSPYTLDQVARRAGLKVVRAEKNPINGGSVRAYLAHQGSAAYDGNAEWKAGVDALYFEGKALTTDLTPLAHFARRAKWAIDGLSRYVRQARADGKRVHILAASTKSNLIWQAAGLTPDLVPAASDRDPRKVGRVLPGTRIPIVAEETSRAAGPDVYLCALSFMRQELIDREGDFLARGGRLVFPLPHTHVVSAAGPDNPSPLPGWEDGRRV
jgi:hypothetical protein